MKTLLARTAIILLFSISSLLAQTQFVVAVKEQKDCKVSDGKIWDIEIGEVFPFLRFISRSEMNGGQPDPSDHEFSLLKFDNTTILAPSSCFQPVPDKDVLLATATYKKMLDQDRVDREAFEKRQTQSLAPRFGGLPNTPSVTSRKSDRARMEQAVWQSGIMPSLYQARKLSDEELGKMYPQALQILETRKLQNSLQR